MPSVGSKFKYLRPEDIRRLDSFEFAPKAIAEGYFSGRRQSRLRGISTEFCDYRSYSPGDDIRLIDWRVFARSDRHYLRTYLRETNMDCHIFLDSSASMAFGPSLPKIDYASFFAASLAYLVTKEGDRSSLLLFDDQIRCFHPPGSTMRHLQHLLHSLENNAPGNPTSLSTSLHKAFPLLKQRGALVIISDFFDNIQAIYSALNPYLARGFRIFLFHILAPEEIQLPLRGLTRFQDLETRERLIAHTAETAEAYNTAMADHIRTLRALAVRRQITYTLAPTSTSFHSLFDTFTH